MVDVTTIEPPGGGDSNDACSVCGRSLAEDDVPRKVFTIPDDDKGLAWWVTRGRQKTFKREIGFLGLIFWGVLTVRIFWHLDNEAIRALDAAYNIASMCVWAFAAAAFGLDAFVRGSFQNTRR